MPLNSLPRVLCVDDDTDSRMILIALLKHIMVEPTAVANAAQALDLMLGEPFDLYLLDAWLPGMDGFELCERIRALDQVAPILFYTGAAFDADRDRARLAGATAFVAKPDVDGMLMRVKQLVAPSSAAAVVAHGTLARNRTPVRAA